MTVRSIHGGKPVSARISAEDANELRKELERALAEADHVLVFSVGTQGTDYVCSRYSAHVHVATERAPIAQFFRMLYVTAHDYLVNGLPDDA